MSLSNSMFSLTVRVGSNVSGLLWETVGPSSILHSNIKEVEFVVEAVVEL